MWRSLLILPALVLFLTGKPASSQTTGAQLSSGVNVSLTTSGFAFTPMIGVLIPLGSGTNHTPVPISLKTQGVSTSVSLRNSTAQDISFVLGLFTATSPKFEFRVYNSDGTLVWDSVPSILPPVVARHFVLAPGEAWRGTAFIPLFINGKALPAGTYTVEALLQGTPEFSATASFVVNNVIAIN